MASKIVPPPPSSEPISPTRIIAPLQSALSSIADIISNAGEEKDGSGGGGGMETASPQRRPLVRLELEVTRHGFTAEAENVTAAAVEMTMLILTAVLEVVELHGSSLPPVKRVVQILRPTSC